MVQTRGIKHNLLLLTAASALFVGPFEFPGIRLFLINVNQNHTYRYFLRECIGYANGLCCSAMSINTLVLPCQQLEEAAIRVFVSFGWLSLSQLGFH